MIFLRSRLFWGVLYVGNLVLFASMVAKLGEVHTPLAAFVIQAAIVGVSKTGFERAVAGA